MTRAPVEPYVAIVAAIAAFAAGFDQTGLVLSYWAGTLAALAYAFFGFLRCYDFPPSRYRFSWRRLVAMLRSSAMPTLTDLTGALFARLDLYLVGIMLGEAPAGIYNVARQMRTPRGRCGRASTGCCAGDRAHLAAPGRSRRARTASRALDPAFQRCPVGCRHRRPVLDVVRDSPPLWAMVSWWRRDDPRAFGVSDLSALSPAPATVAITAASIVVNRGPAALLIGRSPRRAAVSCSRGGRRRRWRGDPARREIRVSSRCSTASPCAAAAAVTAGAMLVLKSALGRCGIARAAAGGRTLRLCRGAQAWLC